MPSGRVSRWPFDGAAFPRLIGQICVSLLGENVEGWRPVAAERLHGDVYRILEQTYDRDIESWQFEPGDAVVCELVNAETGPILAAKNKVQG
jgi:hypothetical protein